MVIKWQFILSFLFQNRVYITGMALVLPQHSIPKNSALPLMAWRPCYEFAQRSQKSLVTPYPIMPLNNLSKFLRKYTKLYARLGRLCFACKCNMLHHDVLLQQITLHSSRVIRNSKTILVSNSASTATIRRATEPRLARWRRQMGSSTPT